MYSCCVYWSFHRINTGISNPPSVGILRRQFKYFIGVSHRESGHVPVNVCSLQSRNARYSTTIIRLYPLCKFWNCLFLRFAAPVVYEPRCFAGHLYAPLYTIAHARYSARLQQIYFIISIVRIRNSPPGTRSITFGISHGICFQVVHR